MIRKEAIDEVKEILTNVVDIFLGAPMVSREGLPGAEFRRLAGHAIDDAGALILNEGFAQALIDLFEGATNASITVSWFDRVLAQLFAEDPKFDLAIRTCHACIVFALAEVSRILTTTQFVNREDVDTALQKLRDNYEEAKEIIADEMDSGSYYTVVEMQATITRHLVKTALPLPRIIEVTLPEPMPTLAISQFLYAEADRAEEIAAENRVIHPAFALPDLKVLSA